MKYAPPLSLSLITGVLSFLRLRIPFHWALFKLSVAFSYFCAISSNGYLIKKSM